MKWDLKTVTSLYLLAIVQDRSLRSLRDLRRKHIGLLESIQREAIRIVDEKWGLKNGSLRMYVHYQPSYCEGFLFFSSILLSPTKIFIDHFHVHMVNANYQGNILGMAVGQAHLLDDIISLVSH